MTTRRRCKVEDALDEYDLDEVVRTHDTVDEYLLTRWNGIDDRPAEGYRSLTQWFNMRLLKRAYDEAGRDTTGTRLRSEYDALTGDDDLLRREVADDLRAGGIDATALRKNMVSWSTMRHHIKDCLDGEKRRQEPTSDWERESVRIARNRTIEKVNSALSALDSKNDLPGGTAADVRVRVDLQCPTCHITIPFDEALDRGYVCEEHLSPTGGYAAEREDRTSNVGTERN